VLLLLAVCVISIRAGPAKHDQAKRRQDGLRVRRWLARRLRIRNSRRTRPSLVGKGSATASRSTYFSRAPRKVSTQPTGVCTDIVNGGFETR